MSLIEVILGAAIVLFVVTSVVSAYITYLRVGLANVKRVQAAFLLEEGIEALRTMRDAGYTANIASLSTTTNYYLAFATSTNLWQSTTSPAFIDGIFGRTVGIADVSRDTGGVIVTSGGSFDSGTKKITISVSWNSPQGTTTKSISAYISNLFNN